MITSSSGRSESRCAKCQRPILDKYYLATKDGVYHSHCLRCEHCDLELAGQVNCYNRNGQIYCRADYERLFHRSATVCSKCGLTVQVGQFVQRASSSTLFHLDCFRCAICDTVLQPGQRYTLLQQQADSGHELFCELHFADFANLSKSACVFALSGLRFTALTGAFELCFAVLNALILFSPLSLVRLGK